MLILQTTLGLRDKAFLSGAAWFELNENAPPYWDAAIAGFGILFSIASRISRTRFRRRIFCFRNRPNLALSPFLTDIIPSSANSPLPSPTSLDARFSQRFASRSATCY